MIVLTVVCLATFGMRGAFGQESAESIQRLEFFETRIRPILIEHCYRCHSTAAKNVRGELLLDSRESSRVGGESGPAVVPGSPEDSLLLSALQHDSFEMPPDRKLPENVIADFEKWIRDGAEDPRVGGQIHRSESMNVATGRRFWSFLPIRDSNIPNVGAGWALSDIDRFVAAKHAQHSVDPAPDAVPQQIIRRLYFVLIGLPPTSDAVAAFEAAYGADSETAVADVVDELLASRHFGERWGRHWLDVARFAESSGGGRSLMFPDAWRFRDYVIEAFNEDRPFDQLVREQIAGDLLSPDDDRLHDQYITGSGYLVLGPINYEEQDKELLRMNVVDEQITSVGRTFLGMTLGCARCHDHKFDPIPTADYYALAGIFRSTRTLTAGNVSGYVTTQLRDGVDQGALKKWTQQQKSLQSEIETLKKRIGGTPSQRISADSLPGIVVDDADATYEGEWTQSSFLAPWVGGGYMHSGKQKTGRTARYEAMLPADGMYSVRISYNWQNSRSADVPIRIRHAEGEDVVHLNERKPATIDGVFVELGQFHFRADTAAVVIVDAENSSAGYVIADAVQFLSESDAAIDTGDPAAEADQINISQMQRELKQLEDQLKQHNSAKPTLPIAMSVADESQPADWHVHVRGEIRNPGEPVPRGFLTAATQSLWSADGPSDTHWGIPADHSGRKEFADWLVSEDNPLTTRVFVNRVWMHVVGEGLVRTPDNFGRTGAPPTHPELLDYLASTFMHDENWSVKTLIRKICLSRTFRMSSQPTDDALQRDPDNEWMSRGFRRQMDAEALRDSMLFVSGQLDLSTHNGRTIGKFSTYDNNYDHAAYPFHARSVYVPSLRNAMLDLFSVFNVANPNVVTGHRNRSILPSQALFLLNSPFVMEQANVTADRFLQMQSLTETDMDQLIRNAWRLALSRLPTDEELAQVRLYLQQAGIESSDAWTAVFHAIFASIDFRYIE
jgi:Protein of unknown function (DUF1553)/Protein of unknown function (DUF1549)/Planctomycete cytochrome C